MTVTDIAAKLAGYFLYVSRGVTDPDDPQTNQLKMHFDFANCALDDILAGRIWISATRRTKITYPTVEPVTDV